MVLRDLGVERATLVAHDMGTSVATDCSARRSAGLLHFELDAWCDERQRARRAGALTPAQKLLRRRWLGPLFARVASATTYRLQLRRILGRNEALGDADLADQFALIRLGTATCGCRRSSATTRSGAFPARWIGALERFDRPH